MDGPTARFRQANKGNVDSTKLSKRDETSSSQENHSDVSPDHQTHHVSWLVTGNVPLRTIHCDYDGHELPVPSKNATSPEHHEQQPPHRENKYNGTSLSVEMVAGRRTTLPSIHHGLAGVGSSELVFNSMNEKMLSRPGGGPVASNPRRRERHRAITNSNSRPLETLQFFSKTSNKAKQRVEKINARLPIASANFSSLLKETDQEGEIEHAQRPQEIQAKLKVKLDRKVERPPMPQFSLSSGPPIVSYDGDHQHRLSDGIHAHGIGNVRNSEPSPMALSPVRSSNGSFGHGHSINRSNPHAQNGAIPQAPPYLARDSVHVEPLHHDGPIPTSPASPSVQQWKLDRDLECVDFNDITVSELRIMLRQRGISGSGKKALLIEKLKLELEGIHMQSAKSTGKQGSIPIESNVASINRDIRPRVYNVSSEIYLGADGISAIGVTRSSKNRFTDGRIA